MGDFGGQQVMRALGHGGLGIVLSQWGLGAGAASDINRDGIVNGADLAIILSSWGACP